MSVSNFITDGSELDTLPCAPGESGFNIKGTTYAGHVSYVEERVPGGMEAMREGMVRRYGSASAEYFDQRFLAASWYDMFPLARAGVVCGELLGVGYAEFLRVRSQSAADNQVRGLYRWFTKVVGGKAVTVRISKVMGTFFDFGEVTILESDARHVAVLVDGVPQPLTPWYVTVVSAYYHRILEIAEAPPAILEYRSEPAGERDGLPLVRLYTDLSWPE